MHSPRHFAAVISVLLLSAAATCATEPAAGKGAAAGAKSIYDYELVDIDGRKTSLAAHRNKVLLIVNVASECGATPQYGALVELQRKYGGKGLVVLGFPANDFGGQEPGSEKEIKEFCSREFAVNFPMFSKISVSGPAAHPLFAHLTGAANRDFTGPVQWNFEKFLVGAEGLLLRRFRTGTEPDSAEMESAIEAALRSAAAGEPGGCADC